MKAELIIAGLLLAAPAAARTRGPAGRPDAGALIVAALSAPTTGYTARGRIQSFAPGRKPKALGMTVYFLPDGRLRREVRVHPGLPPEQVFVDDGSERRLYWPKLGTLWKATMTHEPAAERAARLTSLYSVSVSTGGSVAKRETWRLDFRAPDGSLRRALWVERDNGLLLKCEEYRLDGCAVCLDHIPNAGWFVEIEGSAMKIRSIARRLGLQPADREHRSYRRLIRDAAIASASMTAATGVKGRLAA